MNIKMLARENPEGLILVGRKCDVCGNIRPVEIIMVLEMQVVQLCSACFASVAEEKEALQTRDAAEHPVERTEPGLTVTENATSDDTCPSCSGYGHYLVGNFDQICDWCDGTGHV